MKRVGCHSVATQRERTKLKCSSNFVAQCAHAQFYTRYDINQFYTRYDINSPDIPIFIPDNTRITSSKFLVDIPPALVYP